MQQHGCILLDQKQYDFILTADSDADATDTDEGPPNTFNVLFVATDKDSDRVSPDTDTVCAPPPDNVYPFSDSCTK